jgi:hypothetical protein
MLQSVYAYYTLLPKQTRLTDNLHIESLIDNGVKLLCPGVPENMRMFLKNALNMFAVFGAWNERS